VRVVRYSVGDGEVRSGVLRDREIVDLGTTPPVELLADGGAEPPPGAPATPLADATLHAPIARPGKFFAIGLNYADHAAEAGLPTPEVPVVFAKLGSCVNAPFGDVERRASPTSSTTRASWAW